MDIFRRRRKNRHKNENGAIALVSAFALTLLICFAAFAIDYGLYYYQSAKFQNAVDAAGTAVAANIGATDTELESIAKNYLNKNGIDVADKYKDSLDIIIERKGLLDAETVNVDEYITTGYIKLTVSVDDDAVLANVLGINTWHLKKTAFVKCDADYVKMPKALNYTLFAGSSSGTEANPALEIQGRTGNVTNYVISVLENVINGINEAIVQPIIGIFGGTPNMTDLVHINISEAITNGDVHSNSNIEVGVQALNTSRVKDQDYEGTESNSEAYDESTLADNNEYFDYGQVTYTSVDAIEFTNTSLDGSTHVYVQNQQYLEQTQNALTILNEMNLNTLTSTAELRTKYEDMAAFYLSNKTAITEAQKQEIIAQSANLTLNDDKTISLANQSMIVYDVSRDTTTQMLDKVQEQTLSGLVEELNSVGTDKLYSDDAGTLLFENIADKGSTGGIKYDIVISHKDSDGNTLPDVGVSVGGNQVNRDLGKAVDDTTATNDATVTGAKYALARTFRENLGDSGYITVPNMKPYFVRQVNQSIRNSTKTREELGDSEATGSRTVKEAVSNMSQDLVDIMEKTSYTDDTFANTDDYVKKDTTPLFKKTKATKNSGLTLNTGEKFLGEEVFDSNNILKTPDQFVSEFKNENIAAGSTGASNFTKGAVKKYYNDNVANQDEATKSKYATNYGADAVKKKRDEISVSVGNHYDEKKAEVDATDVNETGLPVLPNRTSVFLGPEITLGTAYEKRSEFNSQMNYSTAYDLDGSKIAVIMPSIVVLGSTANITMTGGATWADSGTGMRSFSYTGLNNSGNLSGKCINGSIDNNWDYKISPNSSAAINGSLNAKDQSSWNDKGGNIDIGDGGQMATLIVNGNLTDANIITLRENSILYVNGNIDCWKLTMHSGAKIYCTGTIRINGSDNGYCDIQNNTLISSTSHITLGSPSLGENAIVNASGVINIIGGYSDKSTSLLKGATLDFSGSTTRTITINGSVYSTGSTTIRPRVNLYGTIKVKGDMAFYGDKDWLSLACWGKLYVTGSVVAQFKMDFYSGQAYVCGNIDASNNSSSDSNAFNAIYAEGSSKIYVGGYVGTQSSQERHIYIADGAGGVVSEGTVFSVYGYLGSLLGDRYPFKNIREFCNAQTNSKIYIGDGVIRDASSDVTISFPNTFQNFGTLYCYDTLKLTGNAGMILSGSGSTLFDKPISVESGDITVKNGHTLYCPQSASFKNLVVSNYSRAVFTSSAVSTGTVSASGNSRILNAYSFNCSAINISGDSRYVCKGNVNTGSITSSSGSQVWVLGTVTSGGYIIDSDVADNLSEIYCGNGSTITAGANLKINGDFCTPASATSYDLSSLVVGKFGMFVCSQNVKVSSNLAVEGGYGDLGVMYITGKVEYTGNTITNNNKMYLMGGITFTGNSETACGFNNSANSETFIGTNKVSWDGTIQPGELVLKGFYKGNGDMYIENNLTVNGCSETWSEYVPNRGESFIMESGNTYVTGDINLTDHRRGMYVKQGSTVSCKNLTVGSSVYNLGKVIIMNNLYFENDGEFSDKKEIDTASLRKGFSFRNGGSDKNKIADAVLYVGGTNGLDFGGCLQNYGKIYCNGGLNVKGYYESGNCAQGVAFLNEDGGIAHFGGNVYMNSNSMLNGWNSEFSTEGNFKYGIGLYNQGKFVVTGTVTNDEQANETVNTKSYDHGYRDSNYFSLRNGSYVTKNPWTNNANPNALFYCGGDLKIGVTETNAPGGSIINFAKMYIGGSLLDYTSTNTSYSRVALWMFNDSKTFVSKDVFAGGGVGIGNDSMFLCGGDYISKRSTKINVECFSSYTIDAGDFYTFKDDKKDGKDHELFDCYVYVGGNMLVNTLGKHILANNFPTTIIPENCSRDTDIYSNSNIYVGGSFYANSKVYMKENVTLMVAGKKSITSDTSMKTILESIENGTVRSTIQGLLDGTDYKCFIYQCLDENICSKLIVNGSTFVRDTAKIRDMAKNYIYGNFKCNDYVEIGKSLYDDDRDESQAVQEKYRENGESKVKYNFSNAGMMSVSGNFNSGKYTKVYASTTLKVGGDFNASTYLTLRHDAKIYVGKKLKAGTSIEGGSYSQFHTAGSMQAVGSFIKIRDCTTVVVGGNMTALGYIELGKYGDYTRDVTKNSDGTYTVKESDFHGVTEGTESSYEGEEGEESGGSTGAGSDSSGTEESIKDTVTVDTEAELASDDSDLAKGGQFYVGRTLASYGSYIKEFAYSRVAVGEYVFTPKYLTLRHNSDMWVMPETFANETFITKQYISQSDGTFLGDLVDKVLELGFKIQQTFMPKNGSIYTLGELTMNKNASLMGTYDAIVSGQCVLRQDTLIYLGHNFECSAPPVTIDWASITGEKSVVGFDSYGTAAGSSNKTAFPVVIFANNSIKIATTVQMRLTYLVANLGDVEIYQIYSKSENAANNAKQLPNAVASYYGDVKYFSMYGVIGALFYAPNGNLNIDGYYTEIWGCGLGDTVDVNSYYFKMHRFSNWRTMNLQIAESGSVYLVSENEYNKAVDNIDDIYMYDRETANDKMSNGAGLFFNFDD